MTVQGIMPYCSLIAAGTAGIPLAPGIWFSAHCARRAERPILEYSVAELRTDDDPFVRRPMPSRGSDREPAPGASTSATQESLVAKPNYHQARKQKELARKARQQEKQQRRSARPSAPETSQVEASATPRDPTTGSAT